MRRTCCTTRGACTSSTRPSSSRPGSELAACYVDEEAVLDLDDAGRAVLELGMPDAAVGQQRGDALGFHLTPPPVQRTPVVRRDRRVELPLVVHAANPAADQEARDLAELLLL